MDPSLNAKLDAILQLLSHMQGLESKAAMPQEPAPTAPPLPPMSGDALPQAEEEPGEQDALAALAQDEDEEEV